MKKREIRRYLAGFLAFCVMMTSFNTVSWADVVEGLTPNKVEFYLQGADIEEEVKNAVTSGEKLELDEIYDTASSSSASEYAGLFGGKDPVYEIFPVISRAEGSTIENVHMRVFVKTDKEADDAYTVTGNEDIIFMFMNGSNKNIDFYANIDGNKTSRVTVNAGYTGMGEELILPEAPSIDAPENIAPEETTAPEESSSAAEKTEPTTEADVTESETAEAENKETTEAVVPETTEAETETAAVETEEPKTEAPETEEPKTEAPETEAPETEAPETDAPEAKEETASLSLKYVPMVASSDDDLPDVFLIDDSNVQSTSVKEVKATTSDAAGRTVKGRIYGEVRLDEMYAARAIVVKLSDITGVLSEATDDNAEYLVDITHTMVADGKTYKASDRETIYADDFDENGYYDYSEFTIDKEGIYAVEDELRVNKADFDEVKTGEKYTAKLSINYKLVDGYLIVTPEMKGEAVVTKKARSANAGIYDLREAETAPVKKIHTLTINYFYEENANSELSGAVAEQPYIATLLEGTEYEKESPVIEGYSTKSPRVFGTMPEEDVTIEVEYNAADGTEYTVRHLKEELDGTYKETLVETKTGKTGDFTDAKVQVYTGFTVEPFTQARIAASSSKKTEIEIRYKRNLHYVYFNSNGGAYVNTLEAKYGQTVTIPSKPERTGYKSLGWYLNGVAYTKKDILVNDEDIEFKAMWEGEDVKYSIVHWRKNLDGETYSYNKTTTGTAKAGKALDPALIENVSEKYYEYDKSTTIAKNQSVIVKGDGSTVVNAYYERRTFTINFKLNSKNTTANNYKIVFVDDSGKEKEYIGNTYSIKAKYEENIADRWPLAANIYVKSGNQWIPYNNLSAWLGVLNPNFSRQVSKVVTMSSDVCNPNSNGELTLTAEFNASKTYTLTYYLECLDESEPGAVGKTFSGIKRYYVPDPNYSQVLRSSGISSFSAKAISGFSAHSSNADISGTKITLWYYRQTYKLDFVNYTGGVYETYDKIKFGTPLEKYKPEDPKRPDTLGDGYEFKGWYTEQGGKGDKVDDWKTFTMPDSSVILYAYWAPIEYKVTLHYNNGQSDYTEAVAYNTQFDEPETEPTKANYKFGGWFDNEKCEGSKYMFSKPILGVTNLYAKWIPLTTVSYTVHYTITGTNEEYAPSKTVENVPDKTSVTEEAVIIKEKLYSPNTSSQGLFVEIGKQNEITFEYAPFTTLAYRIEYVDKDGNELVNAVEKEDAKESRITVNYVNIPGYLPDKYQQTKTLSHEEKVGDIDQNVITFTYTKTNNTTKYYVEHYFQDENNEYKQHGATEEWEANLGAVVHVTPLTEGSHKLNNQLGVLSDVITSEVVAGTKKVVLKAYYDWNMYTVSYRPNGTNVTGTTIDTHKYRYGTSAEALESNYSRNGYMFKYWNTNSSDSNLGTRYAEKAVIPDIKNNIVLNAIWEAERPAADVSKTITNQPAIGQKFEVGQTIKYDIRVENTGNIPLNNIMVKDIIDGRGDVEIYDGTGYTKSGTSAFITSLPVGEIVTIQCGYKVVMADNGNTVTNKATVTSDEIKNPVNEEVSTEIEKTHSITIQYRFGDDEDDGVTKLPTDDTIPALKTDMIITSKLVSGYVADPKAIVVPTPKKDETITFYYYKDINGNEIPDIKDDKYKVTFLFEGNGHLNGTTEFSDILTGLRFKDVVTPPTPVADAGYEFKEWTPELPTDDNFKIEKDITYTAHFVKRTDLSYEVHYYYDDVLDTNSIDKKPGQTFGADIVVNPGKTTTHLGHNFVLEDVVYTSKTVTEKPEGNLVKVYYALDEIGEGENLDKPNNIPDKYEVIFTYRAEANGSLQDGDPKVQRELVWKKTADDKWDAELAVKPTKIPGLKSDLGYKFLQWNRHDNVSDTTEQMTTLGAEGYTQSAEFTVSFQRREDLKYTVQYYYDDETEPRETENGAGALGTDIPYSKSARKDKNDVNYVWDKIEGSTTIVGEENILKVYFLKDAIGGGTDLDEDDGIADIYEVIFTYEVKSDDQATLIGKVKELVKKEVPGGGYDATMAVSPSKVPGLTITDGYKFDNWTTPDKDPDTTTDMSALAAETYLENTTFTANTSILDNLSYNVEYYYDDTLDRTESSDPQTFGTEIRVVPENPVTYNEQNYALDKVVYVNPDRTVTTDPDKNIVKVYYGLDIKGDKKDPDQPSTIPDKYEVIFTYTADNNGILNGADSKTQKAVVVKKNAAGEWDEEAAVKPIAIPGVTPENGYHFANWTRDMDAKTDEKDSMSTFANESYTEDITFTVHFAENDDVIITYQIANEQSSMGYISEKGTSTLTQPVAPKTGTAAGATAYTSNPGYKFLYWMVNGQKITEAVLTPEQVAKNAKTNDLYTATTFTAYYEEPSVTITYKTDNAEFGLLDNDQKTISQSVNVVTGDASGATAEAMTGYKFVNWKLGEREVSIDSTLKTSEINQVIKDGYYKEDAEFVAYFEKDDTQTKNLAYTVNYLFEDGTPAGESTTVKATPWVNDPDTLTVEPITKKIEGYKIGHYEVNNDKNIQVLPTTVDNKSVINVIFVKDSFDYTVRYFYENKAKQPIEDTTKAAADKAVFGQEIPINNDPDKDYTSFDGQTYVLGKVVTDAQNPDRIVTANPNLNNVDVYYYLDEVGTEPGKPDEPDGVADRYQIIFNYVADNNGQVDGTVKEVVTRELENNEFSETNPASPKAEVIQKPNSGYSFTEWTTNTAGLIERFLRSDITTASFEDIEEIKKAKFYADAEFKANFKANTDTKYTVNVYLEANGEYGKPSSEEKGGTTDAEVVLDPESKEYEYAGYVYDSSNPKNSLKGTITADGRLVLSIYFKQQFTVTYDPGTQGTFKEQVWGPYFYNGSTNEFTGEETGNVGYEFKGWIDPTTGNGVTDKVTKNTVYVAQWAPTENNRYHVEYYFQNADNDEYTLDDDKTKHLDNGTYFSTITYKDHPLSEDQILGYTYNADADGAVNSIEIDGTEKTLKFYYDRNDIGYTVQYFYNKTEDESKRDDTLTARYGSKVGTYTDKNIIGYEFDHATVSKENPLTIGLNASENVIKVYYEKAQFEYHIEYYYDGALADKNENGIATYQTVIRSYPDKNIDGYRLEKTEPDPVELTISEKEAENVIKVYYVKDDFNYKVEYYFDNVHDAALDYNSPEKVEFGSVVNKFDDKVKPGYKLPKEGGVENFPMTVSHIEADNVIKVKYERDNFDYNVRYFYEDADEAMTEDEASAVTEKGKFESPIPYSADASKTFDGKTYVLGEIKSGNDGNIVTENKDNNYVHVYYYADVIGGGQPVDPTNPDKPNPDGTADKYQVTFTYVAGSNGSVGGTVKEVVTREKDGDKFSKENPAYPNADVTQTSAPGYNFTNWISDKPGVIQKAFLRAARTLDSFGDAAAISRTGFTSDTTFTANFIANGATTYNVAVFLETEGNYPDTTENMHSYTGTTDTIATADVAKHQPDGYVLDTSMPNVFSGQIKGDNSLVLKLYYKQQFSVTYKAGENGDFEDEVIGGIGYGIDTPPSSRTLTGKTGYEFVSWNPSVVPTVKADAVYTAQWQLTTNNKYTVEHYFQNLDKTYSMDEKSPEEKNDGRYGDPVLASTFAKSRDGYIHNPSASGAINSIKIGDEDQVLKLYYDRSEIPYNVRYYYEDVDNNVTEDTANAVNETAVFDTPISYREDATTFEGKNYVLGKIEEGNADRIVTLDSAKNYVYVFYYMDEIGGTVDPENPENPNPDGTADKYQVTFTYVAGSNGFVSGTVKEVVTRQMQGEEFSDTNPAYPTADVAQTPYDGYNFTNWTSDIPSTSPSALNTFNDVTSIHRAGFAADAEFTANFTASDATKYTVELYLQENGLYPDTTDNVRILEGTTDTEISVDAVTYPQEGYVYDTAAENVTSGTIAGDNSLILKLYFKQQFSVAYEAGDHGTFGRVEIENLDHGSATPKFTGTTTGETGYEFTGWSPAVTDTVSDNVVYVAQWRLTTNNKYTVEHYFQNLDKTYTMEGNAVEKNDGHYGSTVYAEPLAMTKTGYEYNPDAQGSISSIKIGESDQVLKLYYDRAEVPYSVRYFYESADKSITEDTANEVSSKAIFDTPISYKEDATTFNGGTYVFGRTEIGSNIVTLNEADNYVRVYYYADEIGGPVDPENPDKPNPDGTADKYQVTFTYVAGSNGSVGGTVKEVVTREKTGDEFSDSNPAYPSAQVTRTPDGGYNFVNWSTDESGVSPRRFLRAARTLLTFDNEEAIKGTGFTKDAIFTANFIASDATTYKVELYLETEGRYPNSTTNIRTFTGTTDTTATVNGAELQPNGYVFDENAAGNITSGQITGDNGLVLKLYYKQQFSVAYEAGEHGTFGRVEIGGIGYGSTTPEFTGTITGEPGYEFTGWSPAVTDTVSGDVIYVAQWQLTTNNKYTVEHYFQNLDKSYTMEGDPVPMSDGTYGTTIQAKDFAITRDGFAHNQAATGAINSIKIGDQDQTLKLYYDRSVVNYRLDYYYDGMLYETLRENGEATFGDTISGYKDKPRTGYQVVRTEPSQASLVISSDETKNVIRVYYEKASFAYTVEYYFDGQLREGLTTTQNAVFDSVINSYKDNNITGYKLSGTENFPLTIKADPAANVIRVRYDKDSFNYNVRYFYEDADKNVTEDTANAVTSSAVFETGIPYSTDATEFAGKNYILGRVEAGNEGRIVTENSDKNYVNVYYYMDEIGGTVDPENPNPDGVADKYQVTFTYVAGTNGSVGGTVKEVVTREMQGNEFSDTNPAYPTAEVTQTPDGGYNFTNWTSDVAGVSQRALNTFEDVAAIRGTGFTADAEFKANFIASDATTYKVELYLEENGSYPATTDNVRTLAGTTDTQAAVNAADYLPEGYAFDEAAQNVTSGTIAGDNSLVLKLYFKQQFSVAYEAGEHGTFGRVEIGGLGHGSTTPEFTGTITGEPGYEFTGWSPAVTDTVDKNVVYVAQWQLTSNNKYTVEHYFQNLDKTYTMEGNAAEMSDGLYGATIQANPFAITRAGYVHNPAAAGAVNSIKIGENGQTLKLYYDRAELSYRVRYFYEDADKNVTEDTANAVIAAAVFDTPISYKEDATAFEGKNYVLGKIEAGSEGRLVTLDQALNYVNVYYYMDEIGGPADPENPNKPNPDDVADKYQVTFTYLAGANGSVEGTVSEVVTREKQDGEYSETNPAYPKAGVTQSPAAGYRFTNWSSDEAGVNQRFLRADRTLTIFDDAADIRRTGFVSDAIFTANFIASEATTYTVELYYESQGRYADTTANKQTHTGVTDTSVTVNAESYQQNGYVYDTAAANVVSGQVKGDNSLVLKLYFKQQFTVTYLKGTNGTFDGQTTEGLTYGSATPDFSGQITGESRYIFAGWSPEFKDTVTDNVTYVAQWEYIGGNSGGNGGGNSGGNTPGGGSDRPVPGGPGDTTTILPEDVPLANLPNGTGNGDGSDFTMIDDGEVPLAALPKTGNTAGQMAGFMTVFSGLLLAAYVALTKRKDEQ